MKRLLSILLLTTALLPSLQAQDNTIKEALKSYNRKNDTLLMTYFKARANDKQLKELGRDSIPESYRYRVSKVHYSPDNAFKIFVFSGMINDGASIVGFHYSFTQYASGHINENTGFSSIYNITVAGDGNYMITDYDTFLGGGVQAHILKLQQYKLKNNDLVLQQFIENTANVPIELKDFFSKDRKSFLLSLSTDIPFQDDFITYNAKEKEISYNYISHQGNYPAYIPKELLPNGKEHLIVKGLFKLDNGKISGFKEYYEKTL